MKDKEAERWRAARERGFMSWVVQRGILTWGGTIFGVLVAIQLASHQDDIAHTLLRSVTIWPIAGVIIGVSTWYAMEWQYKRYLRNKRREE